VKSLTLRRNHASILFLPLTSNLKPNPPQAPPQTSVLRPPTFYYYHSGKHLRSRNLQAAIIRYGKKVRITLDIAEELVQEIDQIRQSIRVDRAALIKIWLHERVQQEKTAVSKR
jgi:hypothetical protein